MSSFSVAPVSQFDESSIFVDLQHILDQNTWGDIAFFCMYLIPDEQLIKLYPKLTHVISFLVISIENADTKCLEYYVQKKDLTWKLDPINIPKGLLKVGKSEEIRRNNPEHLQHVEWFIKINELL